MIGSVVQLAGDDHSIQHFAFRLAALAEIRTDFFGINTGDLGSNAASREIILHDFFLLRKIYFFSSFKLKNTPGIVRMDEPFMKILFFNNQLKWTVNITVHLFKINNIVMAYK